MANLFELVTPVMLYTVPREFGSGHLPPFITSVFQITGLSDREDPNSHVLTWLSSPEKLPCEMLPSCDSKPEQPNAATFG